MVVKDSNMVSTSKAVQPDEDHIKLGLLGSEVAEREYAWNQLWQLHSERLMRHIVVAFPFLPKDLVANAVLDAYQQLFVKIEAEDFDFDLSLLGWLYRVSYCRAKTARSCLSFPTMATNPCITTIVFAMPVSDIAISCMAIAAGV